MHEINVSAHFVNSSKNCLFATSTVVPSFEYWQYCILRFRTAPEYLKVIELRLHIWANSRLLTYACMQRLQRPKYVPDDRYMYMASCLLLALMNIISRRYRGVFDIFWNFQGGGGGRGVYCILAKMENQKGWGGGVLYEIPSMVGVWIFSGITQCQEKTKEIFAAIAPIIWAENNKRL